MTLAEKEEVASGTMAFHFKKPEGFEFKAGQFAKFELADPIETDKEGKERIFSLAHAPYEKELVIATRMRDTAFKRGLKSLPVGGQIKMSGPYGSFGLHEGTAPAVFLTGGIGITPVRSMIAQAMQEKRAGKIILIYANRTPQEGVFLGDLQALAEGNPKFTFVPVMTAAGEQSWNGEKGHINREMLGRYVKDLTEPIYYLSGPAGMVGAMRELLEQEKVRPEKIKAEEFSGY